MQVGHLDIELLEIFGQILAHALGQRRHEDTFVTSDSGPNLGQEIVDLTGHRPDLDWRIEQSGRADDLLGGLRAAAELILGRCGRDIDDLVDMPFEFGESQRSVVERARQTKTVLHERLFAGPVAVIHATDLGHTHVRFIDQQQEIVGKIIEKCGRLLARLAVGQVTAIVLDPFYEPCLLEHFDIKTRALLETLRFQQFARQAELGQARLQL